LIKNFSTRVKTWILKMHWYQLVLISYLFNLLAILFMALFFLLVFNIQIGASRTNEMSIGTDWTILFNAAITVPIFETWLNQKLVFQVIRKLFKNKLGSHFCWVYCLFSAFIFGLLHPFDEAYVVATFFCGLTFSFVYIFAKYKRWHAFWLVVLIHGMQNATAFISRFVQ